MILVFDTSTNMLAIGLANEAGELVGHFRALASPEERGIHDAKLASETDMLLREAGAKASEIERIGVIIGPGSFTGLRIGLSFAKGLALATGAGIVPLTQHEVMKEEMPDFGAYIITPGYRSDLLYFAETEFPRNIRLLKVEEFLKLPKELALVHHLCSTEEITDIAERTSIFLVPSLPVMVNMTAASTELLSGDSLESLEPLYITEFQPMNGQLS